MLTITNVLVPNNTLSYLAFRVACLDTLERIVLAQQFGPEATEGFGYLTEVPFLRAVPPQVQLDLLSHTWHKHMHRQRLPADLVDEAVVFAVCEIAARIAEQEPPQFDAWARSGPQRVSLAFDQTLPDRLRDVHLELPNEGDFLLISQFEDFPPLESLSLKAQCGLEPRKCDAMFEVLGRWQMTAGFSKRIEGLLTEREMVQAAMVLKSTTAIEAPSHPEP